MRFCQDSHHNIRLAEANNVIDRCFNPNCRKRLDYLRDGRVVRVIRGKAEDASVEHYWLCGACYLQSDFDFRPDGSVGLGGKHDDLGMRKINLQDVVLPERRKTKRTHYTEKPN